MVRFVATLLLMLVLPCLSSRGEILESQHSTSQQRDDARTPISDKEAMQGAYVLTKSRIAGERDYFRREFGENPNLEFIRNYLEGNLSIIFGFWHGTAWDFNGTTETPQEGSIACGYFVSTTLRDVGYNINRFSLARLPSEEIIEAFVDNDDIHRFSNAQLDKFCDYVEGQGEGIYIVGLDRHVGFLLQQDGETRFIHSSYGIPRQVVDENARASTILGNSEYRVIGKLFDEKMVSAWFDNKRLN